MNDKFLHIYCLEKLNKITPRIFEIIVTCENSKYCTLPYFHKTSVHELLPFLCLSYLCASFAQVHHIISFQTTKTDNKGISFIINHLMSFFQTNVMILDDAYINDMIHTNKAITMIIWVVNLHNKMFCFNRVTISVSFLAHITVLYPKQKQNNKFPQRVWIQLCFFLSYSRTSSMPVNSCCNYLSFSAYFWSHNQSLL